MGSQWDTLHLGEGGSEARNCLSGVEGSQAVPALPSATLAGLRYAEIIQHYEDWVRDCSVQCDVITLIALADCNSFWDGKRFLAIILALSTRILTLDPICTATVFQKVVYNPGQNQGRSHVTVGHSAGLSWCQTPILGALSGERTGLSLVVATLRGSL
jgi:hypothetical protein